MTCCDSHPPSTTCKHTTGHTHAHAHAHAHMHIPCVVYRCAPCGMHVTCMWYMSSLILRCFVQSMTSYSGVSLQGTSVFIPYAKNLSTRDKYLYPLCREPLCKGQVESLSVRDRCLYPYREPLYKGQVCLEPEQGLCENILLYTFMTKNNHKFVQHKTESPFE